jgi:hypothetical protein
MTVSTTTLRADYTGNGATTSFTVPFYFTDETHIQVLRTQISTGVVTTLALTTDYTVTGEGVSVGGSITAVTAPTADQRISILRNVPLTQLTDYVENDPFPAETHEAALDLGVMRDQQLQEQIDRALTLSANSTGVSAELPTPEASTLIGWSSDALSLVNYEPDTADGLVSAAMAPVVQAGTLALGRTAFGATSVGGAVFTATDAAAARTAIGAAATGATGRANLGFTAALVNRAFGSYATNADLTTVIPADDTIPQNTEGTEIISVTLTPTSASSRVRLRFRGQFALTSGGSGVAAVFSSASANALAATIAEATANNARQIDCEWEYVPGVTTALTFTVRVGPVGAYTMRMNGLDSARLFGGVSAATLVVEEIAV